MDDVNDNLVDASGLINRTFGGLSGGFGVVMSAWRAAAGPQICQHALPSSLREGVLRVRCSHATWTSELQHLAPQLLEELQRRLGVDAPTSIRVYTGRISHINDAAIDTPTIVPPVAPLTPQARAEAHATVTPLQDPDLRQRLQRAIEASSRLPRRE